MKIGDLIKKLEILDPNLEVICFCEDEAVLPSSRHSARFFEIDDIEKADGTRQRDKDDIPGIKYGSSSSSESFALMRVSADF